MVNTIAFQLCVSVPLAKVLAVPAEEHSDCLGFFGGSVGECVD